ncbi:MAG: DUF4330 family protein [Clostridia bacterium]|nr:DUF4330 family protein [Clostridia bacterium]
MKKFSIIDVLIILFLVIIIVFGFLKVKNMIVSGQSEQKVHFTMLAADVDKGTGDIIKEGDVVSISLKEKAYATVIGVTETEHYEDKFNQNLKRYVSQPVDGVSDILLELECDAKVSDTEITNGNVPLRVGEESYIHGKGYSLRGYIVIVNDVVNE